MKSLRALFCLVLVSAAVVGGGAFQDRVAAAAGVSATTPLAAEDAGLQARTFGEAYNLLLDHYVHPLDTASLLRAGWDELAKEAAGKAATPAPPPALTGDRAGDMEAMRGALTAYIGQANSSPVGFVPVHAVLRGMVRFVDEGHTYFLDPQQYTDYQSWSRGDNTYVGIGISVSSKNSQARIVEVYEDTPAQRAGLHAGDLLVRIADQNVSGLALDEMTSLVRGPAGTSVQIVVRRGDDPQELTVSVERAEIHLQFVKQHAIQDDIGYVSLRGFPEPSVVDTIEQDVSTFQAAGVQGLVLDLRGNSGGRIDVGTRLLILSAEGKPLNKVGVVPDEVITADPGMLANGDDPVVSRAVDILHDELAARGASSGVSSP
ncbi:MAG: PDZ domain-containing protein [Chloroflexi bacterium]|nr:PDZ domain-containing protein [Chloroflexota bacterium]